MNIVTQTLQDSQGGVVRFVQNPAYRFDASCLDTDALLANGLIDGKATAGRGNTVFFTLHGQSLVLRHYRRGGLVRHFSKRSYLYTGMANTRAMREFDLLVELQTKGLAAPMPYACKVQRCGLFYSASLVTHRLPGDTLASALLANGCLSAEPALNEKLWRGIGELIATFHIAGVYHADLNAHNIMIDETGGSALIDFDRGKIQAVPNSPGRTGWCYDNISRLERSLHKVCATLLANNVDKQLLAQNISYLKAQWTECIG